MNRDNFLYWVAVAVTAGLFLGGFGIWGRWMWGLAAAYFKDWFGARRGGHATAGM